MSKHAHAYTVYKVTGLAEVRHERERMVMVCVCVGVRRVLGLALPRPRGASHRALLLLNIRLERGAELLELTLPEL